MPKGSYRSSGGFTTVELLVVVMIVAALSASVKVGISNLVKKARDARRIADFDATVLALQNYRFENPTYPNLTNGHMYIFSTEKNFLSPLVPRYISRVPRDPVNKVPNDTDPATFDWFNKQPGYYAYYYYGVPAEHDAYGCGSGSKFAVLGIRKLEALKPKPPRKAYCGPPAPFNCPAWGISYVCRDWSLEFDHSILLPD